MQCAEHHGRNYRFHQNRYQMTFSIIIPAYNAEAYLKRCLDSILSQNHSDYEVIVIDDGSTDGTSNI